MSSESESAVRKVLNKETSGRSRTRDRSAICYEYEDDGEDVRVTVDPSVDVSRGDFIRRSEPDARAYDDALPELPLPGSGDLLEDGDDPPD